LLVKAAQQWQVGKEAGARQAVGKSAQMWQQHFGRISMRKKLEQRSQWEQRRQWHGKDRKIGNDRSGVERREDDLTLTWL
jgi:hypothetical protein